MRPPIAAPTHACLPRPAPPRPWPAALQVRFTDGSARTVGRPARGHVPTLPLNLAGPVVEMWVSTSYAGELTYLRMQTEGEVLAVSERASGGVGGQAREREGREGASICAPPHQPRVPNDPPHTLTIT